MLNEMKYVYEVYKEKSFSKAAKKLFISQPALSNMVRKAACWERIAAEMEASGTASGQERGRGQKTGGASGSGTSDAAETAKDKNRGRQREKKLKFSYMEQKEWETIEDDIAALEEAIADLEQQMQDSARDYTALNGIIKEKEEKEALLEEKMDRWMYLNDLAEKIEAQAAAHK